MKAAIHALKYDRVHPAVRGLGRMLALAIAQIAPQAPVEMVVVPVPLHRSKYAERGFNQARVLADQALESLRKSHPQWQLTLAPQALSRVRATENQAGLPVRQRRENMRAAFLVSDPVAIAFRNVLLIDDILTTGATARAAAHTLIKSGAASVWVATLARARRVHDSPPATAHAQPHNDGLSAPAFTAALQHEVSYSSHDQPSF
jgi:ComF family protein